MSKENVEVMLALFAAWNAGDMNAVRDLFDPDVVVLPPQSWPEPGPEVGRDAVMRQFERLRGAWDADALEPIGDFIHTRDRVAVRQVWHGSGHGPASDMEMTNVIAVREGKIVHQEFFWDHAEALAT